MKRIIKFIVMANIYFSLNVYSAEMRLIEQSDQPVILENFETYPLNKFPELWEVYFKKGKKFYSVTQEQGNKFLKASVDNASFNTALRVCWKIKDFPYFSWRWRIKKFPVGADERNTKTHDSAAGVYVLFKQKFRPMPRVIKYIWSQTMSPGTREFYKKNRAVVVVRKGAEQIDTWITEKINLKDDFDYFFKGKNFTITGVSILSDSDATASYAEADYDDFTVLPELDEKNN